MLIPDVVPAGADGEAGEGLPEDDEGDHQRGGAPQDVPGVRATAGRAPAPSPSNHHG